MSAAKKILTLMIVSVFILNVNARLVRLYEYYNNNLRDFYYISNITYSNVTICPHDPSICYDRSSLNNTFFAVDDEQSPGTIPLVQYYKAGWGHYVTTYPELGDRVVAQNYTKDGVVGYIYPHYVAGANYLFTIKTINAGYGTLKLNLGLSFGSASQWAVSGQEGWAFNTTQIVSRVPDYYVQQFRPIQRFYWKAYDSYFVMSREEGLVGYRANSGYRTDPILCYGAQNNYNKGLIPLYRLLRQQGGTNDYYYTTNRTELPTFFAKGFYLRGVEVYLYPTDKLAGFKLLPFYVMQKKTSDTKFFQTTREEEIVSQSQDYTIDPTVSEAVGIQGYCFATQEEANAAQAILDRSKYPCEETCAAFYSQCNYSGEHTCLCENQPLNTFANASLENMTIYSLTIPSGFDIFLYQDTNLKGDAVRHFDTNQTCLDTPVHVR